MIDVRTAMRLDFLLAAARCLSRLAAVLFAAASPGAFAQELPDLGDASRGRFSEAREAELGREIMHQIRDSGFYLDDPVLTHYLNALGDRLAAASSDPSRRYDLFAVRDATLNAFALPGGYIGVHTGLISASDSESELAGVLAHEIAHVSQQHIARMIDAQRSTQVSSLLAIAVAILAARSDPQASSAALHTAQAMAVQNQLNFTREHEREADRIGYNTLTAAGFAPQGMASFFERLQAQGRFYDNSAPAYLRTHPLTYERIADLQNRLARQGYRQHEDDPRFRFVRARVQCQEGRPEEAAQRFQARVDLLAGGTDQAALAEALYALTCVHLRDADAARAAQTLDRLLALPGVSRGEALREHALVDYLHGETLLAQGRAADALAALQAGLKRHGADLPLVYLYARTLLRAGRAAEAQRFIDQQLAVWSSDIPLLRLSAQSHAALGHAARAHLAQARVHELMDEPHAAIEQLTLAQGQSGADFYTLSIIDARLRALKAALSDESAR